MDEAELHARAGSFEHVADAYDRVRPAYPGRLLDAARRAALLRGIAEVIDAHGGAVRIRYVTGLFLARRTPEDTAAAALRPRRP